MTAEKGALLILDEVINGFRFGFHGYGRVAGVQPDLTTLGKILGGGLPVGGVVGRKDILERLAPLGGVYQAGTMAGNPVALAAGIATLDILRDTDAYARLDELGKTLEQRFAQHALAKKARLVRVGSIVWPYFETAGALPKEASDISAAAAQRYHGAYRGWLAKGVYLPPSAYEVSFLSTAHTYAHLDQYLDALAAE